MWTHYFSPVNYDEAKSVKSNFDHCYFWTIVTNERFDKYVDK